MSPVQRSSGGGSSSAGGLVVLFNSTLGAAAANIDTGANGVASGHGCLLIEAVARTVAAGSALDWYFRFNGDSGANYDWAWVRDAGGAVNAVNAHGDTGADVSQMPGTSVPANYASPVTLNIPAYDQTVFFKTGSGLGGSVGQVTATQERTIFSTFLWRNTAAINQVLMFCPSGNLDTGSRLTIYGTQ